MALIGGLTGLWMITLLTIQSANVGETQKNSLNEPDIPFPPACPRAENLAAICHQGQGRPRYPDSFFRPSGASYLRRQGKAINRLESWYTLCCSGGVAQQSSQILCCAKQAWKQALSQFCDEEYGIMTVVYECCESRDETRWTCFDSELPNPDYNPTPGYTAPSIPQEPGFTFNATACLPQIQI